MSYRLVRPLAACLGLTLSLACGPSAKVGGDGGGGGGDDAAGTGGPDARGSSGRPDATPASVYPDADLSGGDCGDAWMCDDPVADGCMPGADDVCGDGLDNNCNGSVDEGCACEPGSVQPCFRGQPGRRGVGACVDGMQTCFGDAEISSWGECTGGIAPTTEACDGQDNNCNGCVDDHPDCCEVSLACPGPGDLPDGHPFAPYVIHGADFYPGAVTSWSWTVTGGPCDQLLLDTAGNTSFELTGATTNTLTLTPTLSGDYTVTMTAHGADGTTYTCTFIVHVFGPGLRVELCWDTTGDTDIDLHVHRDGTTTNWFTTSASGNADTNPDDCYYRNCQAAAFFCPFGICDPTQMAEWGYAGSPLSECNGGPDGPTWDLIGSCHNPRLDIDNIFELGRPENINVDVPKNGASYRVAVQYYQDHTDSDLVTHPLVNIYCGGYLKSSYGVSPDVVPGFDHGEAFEDTGNVGLIWRVADVTTAVSGGTTTDCTIDAIHPPGSASGYWVTSNVRTF